MQLFVFDRYTPDVPNFVMTFAHLLYQLSTEVFNERDFRPGFLRYYSQPLCLNQILPLRTYIIYHILNTILSLFFFYLPRILRYILYGEDLYRFVLRLLCESYSLVEHINIDEYIYMYVYINQSIHQIVSLPIYYYLFKLFFLHFVVV